MKVLFIASEAVPFVKTGGLGDVIGSLPKALNKEGIEARIVLPKYEDIPQILKKEMKWLKNIRVEVGWRNQFCGIEKIEYDGVIFYFIDNEYYFKRKGLYGFYDDGERYAFFCRGALEILPHVDFQPDILHCHDWQSGMVSTLLKAHYHNNSYYQKMKTVFTIHNLQYQGIFPHSILEDLLGLGDEYFTIDGVEFYQNVSFMKGALNFSDRITTVSNTYAEEIQSSFYGERLEGLLQKRKQDLYGVLNGLDYSIYNPSTDPHLFTPYNINDIEKKPENKLKLQEMLGIEIAQEKLLIAMITRLTSQKGLDLVECVIEDIVSKDLQLVILGTGEERYEQLFKRLAEKYPQKVSANICFDSKLAQQIYGASDMFLMPSLFEPCGLSQLIALRYGSLPIVRETGGLKDTVIPFNQYTEEGNGFSFANYNGHEMLHTIERAIETYKNKDLWKKLVRKAMSMDYSWKQSAQKYKKLYQSL
ncbi:starch synthase [Anaerovirgula multivorans]|uniref:Glycogen synthase n=1 Tax=Anaerovirgula multivorans TaxID=312168 RepID=A0A239K5T0_9FIRM|nr:glycogen synthase GlgA [Anaerovirgula multivorans]SNT13320.1 starch synthase [Anaerovirgula multivorans]